MDYEDIKNKITGWLKDKEGFNDKDLYFLFKDLSEDSWENIRGEGEEEIERLDGEVNPDSLEAYGEEEKAEIDETEEDEELPGFDDIPPEEGEEDEEKEDLEEEVEEPKKETKPIYAKKPRVKTT